jgi:hypothetical protein
MAAPTRVLDETRFEARARIWDIVALGIMLVVGGTLLFEMYSLGYTAAEVARTGGNEVFGRDRMFVFMIIEIAIFTSAFCWTAYRILSGSARRVGG